MTGTLVLSFFGLSTRGGRTEMTILTRRALRVGLRVALRRGPFTRLACLVSKAHLVLNFLGFTTRGGVPEMTILTLSALRVCLCVALRRGPFTRLTFTMSKAHLVLSLSFAVRRCFRPESTLPTCPTCCVLCGRAFGHCPLSGSANLVGCRANANAYEQRYTAHERHRCVRTTEREISHSLTRFKSDRWNSPNTKTFKEKWH